MVFLTDRTFPPVPPALKLCVPKPETVSRPAEERDIKSPVAPLRHWKAPPVAAMKYREVASPDAPPNRPTFEVRDVELISDSTL